MITYLRVIKNFEGTEEDGDSVAETNLPGILTCNGLIFVGKEHTTKSTKIYTPRKFLRVWYHVSDRGLQHIINLISSLFHWVSVFYGKQSCTLNEFPKTIYSLKRTFGVAHEFDQYCVCTSCNTLYTEEASKITNPNNSQITSYIEYPNHPQKSHRTKCGVELMKTVKFREKTIYIHENFLYTIVSQDL